MQKQMISISERRAEHLFTGQNTQQTKDKGLKTSNSVTTYFESQGLSFLWTNCLKCLEAFVRNISEGFCFYLFLAKL